MLELDHTKQEPGRNRAWDDAFVFDVALRLEGSGEDIEEILSRHGKTADELKALSHDKLFNKKLRAFREDIKENGTTFKLKARTQAEALLSTSWDLIHSIDVLPSVKADLIKSTVKWAGLEPTKDDAGAGAGAGGVTIHINLDGQDVPVTARAEPTTIEHDEEILQAS